MKESFGRSTSNQVGKVLAVNSDREIIYILEANLAQASLEVISTKSGQEALNELNKEKPDIIIIDPELPDIDGIELCQKLKHSESTYNIPIILVTDKTQGSKKIDKIVNSVNYYITKPFDPKNVVDLVLSCLKQKQRVENLNPLTRLPNETQVNAEIVRLIERKKTFTAMYIAMNDLRTLNKVYGYDQGDRIIQLLAEIIDEAVRLFGNPDDLVGHLGGDKFMVVSTLWKARPICRRIIADFNRRIKSLYTDQYLQRGYIAFESPSGIEAQSPIMSLYIAVISNQNRSFNHHLEVREAATEQMEFLKRFPGSKTFFDFQKSEHKSNVALPNLMISSAIREEVKAMYNVSAWLDYIISELQYPITGINDCLDSLEQSWGEKRNLVQQKSLKTIRDNFKKLNNTISALTDLKQDEWIIVDTDLEKLDINDTLNWISKKLKDVTEKYRVEIEIEGAEDRVRILVDKRKLIQCLLYLLRGEIRSSIPEGKLTMRVTEKDDESVSIQLMNHHHYIAQETLSTLIRDRHENMPPDVEINQLYPAKLLVEAIGGKLSVTSTKTKGTTYTIIVPKKWQCIMQESRDLQLAVDVSRREARAELSNLERQLALLVEQVPQAATETLEKLQEKVQELEVLCNRSLFLAEEYSVRLETKQDRLLQHEQEQVVLLEAIITICQEIAGSMGMNNVFDLRNAKYVAKYALAIAQEMKLPNDDKQILYQAALLKDLGITLSPQDMVESMVVNDIYEATSVRKFFTKIWQALSIVPSLSQALNVIFYRYEKYRGDNLPLVSRILAVADTFDSMITGRPPHEKLPSDLAVQKVADSSGLYFDPYVVKTFLMLWKNNKLDKSFTKTRDVILN